MGSHTPSDKEIRDDLNMDPDDFWELSSRGRSYSWIVNLDLDPILTFPRSKTTWRAGPYFKERVLHHHKSEVEPANSEASAICIATQVAGSNVGMKAMLKTRFEIPPWHDYAWEMEDGDSYITRTGAIGKFAYEELKNLETLTNLGSTCTPKLIDCQIRFQRKHEYVVGGFMMHTLMEKVPGHNLLNFGDFTMSERNQVRIAFGKCIRELFSYGYDHSDPHRRNLMWDSKTQKCTIIDLEEVEPFKDRDKHRKFATAVDFLMWGIQGTESDSDGGIDPMVPEYGDRSVPDLDDATLEKLAADSEGKEIYFWDFQHGRREVT